MKPEINLEFLIKVLTLTSDISYMDIWWRTDGEYAPVSIFINCNNVFDKGLADCECITPDNIQVFEESLRDIRAITNMGDKFAPILFCARLRNRRPLDSVYPDNEALWPLFNACGPYTLYPDEEVAAPFVEQVEIKNWFRRLIEFINSILIKMAGGIVEAAAFIWGKIENVV